MYKLLWINQAYYWRYKYKTHKHYNYFEGKFKQKVFTKIFNAKLEYLGSDTKWSN
jgi:hypothetical protein